VSKLSSRPSPLKYLEYRRAFKKTTWPIIGTAIIGWVLGSVEAIEVVFSAGGYHNESGPQWILLALLAGAAFSSLKILDKRISLIENTSISGQKPAEEGPNARGCSERPT